MNLAIIRQQIDALLLAHPELAEDDVLRADMVEGLTDAHEFLQMLERRRKATEDRITGLDVEITAAITPLKERKARMERREETMRKVIRIVMEAASLRKVELLTATISLNNGSERLVINDETSVPKELCRIKYTPDKVLIKAMLKAGEKLNWAAIVQGEPGVTIRPT